MPRLKKKHDLLKPRKIPKSDPDPQAIRDRTAERLGMISGAELFNIKLSDSELEKARLEDDVNYVKNPAPKQEPFVPLLPVAPGVVKKEKLEVPAIVRQQAWEMAQAKRKGVEPMAAATKTAEVQQAIGAEMLKGIKEAGKDMAKGNHTGATLSVDGAFISPETIESLQTLVANYQTVGVQIRRKNHLTQTYASLRAIPEVAPSLLISPGVDELVRDWSGGGEYEISIVAPGMKPIKIYRQIEGDPLPAKPDRNNQQTPAGALPAAGAVPGAPAPAFVPTTSGIPAGITWQQVPGQPWNWKATPNPMSQLDPTMAMMMSLLMDKRGGSDGDERLRELERRMSEEKRELERRLEEERHARAEEARRREDERARELQNSRIEQLAQLIQQQHTVAQQAAQQAAQAAQADEKWKTLAALAPMLTPVVTAMLTRGDAQMAVFTKMLDTQQGSSQQSIDVLKTLLERPGPEDRMAKMMGVVSDMMAAQVSSTSSLLQSGLLNQGGDSPAVQIVSQILSTVGEVGKVMLAAKMGMGMDDGDDDSLPSSSAPALPAPRPQAQATSPSTTPSQTQQEPTQWPEAAQVEQVAGLEESASGEAEEATEANPEAEGENEVLIDITQDTAFVKIFELIVQGGDVKEIAVRMWRHAGSGDEKKGHPLAKEWIKDPVAVGQHILSQIVGLPPERIVEVTNGIVELKAFIRNGGDPEQYAVTLKPKRGRGRPKLIPVAEASEVTEVEVPAISDSQDQVSAGSEITSTVSE